jgi:cobalt/nickel transport protein
MSPERKRLVLFLAGGLLVSFLLAGVVSNFASGSPDGLDSATLEGCTTNADGAITGGDCPAKRAGDHELAKGPLADYAVKGIDNQFVATGLSGVIGVLVVFGIGGGLFWLVRRRPSDAEERAEAASDADQPVETTTGGA